MPVEPADPSFPPHLFAQATREEVWSLRNGEFRCTREHREAGFSVTGPDGRLFATSDPAAPLPERWDVTDEEMHELQDAFESAPTPIPDQAARWLSDSSASIRIRRTARLIASAAGRHLSSNAEQIAIEIERPGQPLMIVTDAAHLQDDLFRLIDLAAERALTPLSERPLPLLWKEGSGSVLLHEAAGHAVLSGDLRPQFPEWLVIDDDPRHEGIGRTEIDDCGETPGQARLSAGERPAAWRRETFRDTPLRRMTTLIGHQQDAPFDLPDDRIEVLLIGGGDYDFLRDRITIRISAAFLVKADGSIPLAPFVLRIPAGRIANVIIGARGEPRRYPGVLCSDEGQRVGVGSLCCEILTTPIQS
ncbi:MAG TPA: hypothetical protein VM534_00270 [Thermoanaerobaculia bacterium]|nr:hypothetical protein [Thermoanaerobaculia bacterium]